MVPLVPSCSHRSCWSVTSCANPSRFANFHRRSLSPLVSGAARRTDAGNHAGTLVRTKGPSFAAAPWDKTTVTRTPVGTFKLTFADGNDGMFQYQLTLGLSLIHI